LERRSFVDAHLHDVAVTQEAGRVAMRTDAFGRPGHDDVAGLEGDERRQEGDQARDREDHAVRARVLHALAIDLCLDLRPPSRIASSSTRYGPHGPKVSGDLPTVHCEVWVCRSRALTSLNGIQPATTSSASSSLRPYARRPDDDGDLALVVRPSRRGLGQLDRRPRPDQDVGELREHHRDGRLVERASLAWAR
jgi:hypothetical protein